MAKAAEFARDGLQFWITAGKGILIALPILFAVTTYVWANFDKNKFWNGIDVVTINQLDEVKQNVAPIKILTNSFIIESVEKIVSDTTNYSRAERAAIYRGTLISDPPTIGLDSLNQIMSRKIPPFLNF